MKKFSTQKYSFGRRQKERVLENTLRKLNKVRWKYRNLIYLLVGITIAYIIISSGTLDTVVSNFKDFGYLGAVLSGLLYTFSLTTAPATAIFYKLGKTLNPFLISVLGAVGCVIGDYLIFRFVKNELMEELKTLTQEISDKMTNSNSIFKHLILGYSVFYRLFPFSNLLLSENFRVLMFKISNSKALKRAVVAIAGLVIASPLPDEIGITLLGMIKFKTKYFVIFSFLLNFTGIFLISYFGGIA